MAKAETKIVTKIREALEIEFPESYFRKIHGNPYQHVGIPDLIGCVQGLFIGLEVKTDTGKTSKIQDIEGQLIIKAGGIHGVVTSPDEAVMIVKLGLKILYG